VKSSKKLGLITLVLIPCLALLFLGINSCNQTDSKIVAWVNSEPITVSELHHFMLLNRATVYNEFYEQHSIDYTPEFWITDVEGKVPLDILKKRALEESITFKLQQILAKSEGIEVETNFDEIMLDRVKMNEKRKMDLENGQVLFGPVELSERLYVNKIRDDMIQLTKDQLARGLFLLSPKQLEQDYHEFISKKKSDDPDTEVVDFSSFSAIRQNEYTHAEYESLVEELKLTSTLVVDDWVYDHISLP